MKRRAFLGSLAALAVAPLAKFAPKSAAFRPITVADVHRVWAAMPTYGIPVRGFGLHKTFIEHVRATNPEWVCSCGRMKELCDDQVFLSRCPCPEGLQRARLRGVDC